MYPHIKYNCKRETIHQQYVFAAINIGDQKLCLFTILVHYFNSYRTCKHKFPPMPPCQRTSSPTIINWSHDADLYEIFIRTPSARSRDVPAAMATSNQRQIDAYGIDLRWVRQALAPALAVARWRTT